MSHVFVDTHAHLYVDSFKDDLPVVLENARKAGVERIYLPNIDIESVEPMLALAEEGYCLPALGLHPCSVGQDFEKELAILEPLLSQRKFAAIGEIGTDLYWDKTYFEEQKEAFSIQVGWAKKYNLPVMIHCRESIDETIELVSALKDENLTGVFHCFTGSLAQAEKIIELGFYLGIGGVVTYKNGGLDKVIPHLNPDYLVLETDSPYLPPVPHRGKRNESAFLPIIAQKVADLRQASLQEISAITTKNAYQLFASSL